MENYMIRLAETKDLDEIMKIIEEAKLFLKENGVPQWQNGYPNKDSFKEDILKKQLYVFEDSVIKGVFVLSKETESCYITDFWPEAFDYLVIHRIAVKNEYKGENIAGQMFDFSFKKARETNKKSIRVDTHEKNIIMQKLLKKHNFEYCGIIYLQNIVNLENKRQAYWYLLD